MLKIDCAIIRLMPNQQWPDELVKPSDSDVAVLLSQFWDTLAELPDLLNRGENLLCAGVIHSLREVILQMMLALNGIAYPVGTRSLNTYLSPSQRRAVEKTLILPRPNEDGWIGQAVALVVIYRWYAPQLVTAFSIEYPGDKERTILEGLDRKIPDWPRSITTDMVDQ